MTKVGRKGVRLSFHEIRRPPLVIQLARHCPMILDRPPIHRFNAIHATCDNLSPLFSSIVVIEGTTAHPVDAYPWTDAEYDDKWRAGRSISSSQTDSPALSRDSVCSEGRNYSCGLRSFVRLLWQKKKGNVKNVFIPYSLKVYRCIRRRGNKETGFSFIFFLNFCLK